MLHSGRQMDERCGKRRRIEEKVSEKSALVLSNAKALARLAKEPVPDYVLKAYNVDRMEFGPDYIIPKPVDLRLIEFESAAVAEAAIKTGVARKSIADMDAYRALLRKRIEASRKRLDAFVQTYPQIF